MDLDATMVGKKILSGRGGRSHFEIYPLMKKAWKQILENI
jgi:hypothetical protein